MASFSNILAVLKSWGWVVQGTRDMQPKVDKCVWFWRLTHPLFDTPSLWHTLSLTHPLSDTPSLQLDRFPHSIFMQFVLSGHYCRYLIQWVSIADSQVSPGSILYMSQMHVQLWCIEAVVCTLKAISYQLF